MTSFTYGQYFKNRAYLLSLITGVLFLVVGLIVNRYTGMYAEVKASSSVTDIILDNIPVFQLDGTFVYGPVVFWLFVIFICVRKPERLPFAINSVALFIIIRSIFITLTHIGPSPDQIEIASKLAGFFFSDSDLFFSGHTGLPFLMALIFWHDIRLRVVFTMTAIFFGSVVLLAHLHYSIDVLAAFFITYTIYHIAKVGFKKDFRLFHEGLKT